MRVSLTRLFVVATLLAAAPTWVQATQAAEPDDDLAAMADQLDAADRADFMEALDKASACTQARNFSCTDAQLKKAARLAHGASDKRQLALARTALSTEQAAAAAQARQLAELAEQERKLAEAEERLRAAEVRAREAEADSQPSTASQLLQFGALVAQNYGANRAGAAAAAQAGKLPLADLSAERQRIADQRARLAAAREQAEAARQAGAQAAQAAQARAAQARATAAAGTPNASPRPASKTSAENLAGGSPSQASNMSTSPGTTAAPPNAATPSTAAGGKRSYPGLPRIRNEEWSDYQLDEKPAKTWCERWTRDIRDMFLNSEDKLISIGACSCKRDDSMAPMQPTYGCKFKYVWQQNVPGNDK